MKSTTIYSALEAMATTKQDAFGNTYLEISSSVSPSLSYWLAAKQYAEKTLKPMLATGKTTMLNVGMGYDATTNDDLIQDAILKFGTRYSYFVSKFNEINSSNISTPEEKVSEFNRIISTTIPSMLGDEWRKISEDVEYTDLDTKGNRIKKQGKGLRGTHSSHSLFSNQNKSSNGSEDEVTLIECLSSSRIDTENKIESSDFIADLISQLSEVPRQMLGFMAMYSSISSNDILKMINNGKSNRAIFNYILESFSIEYDCPELLSMFKNRYSESELTYNGSMNMKKVLDNERSWGKKKVKTYVENNNLRSI